LQTPTGVRGPINEVQMRNMGGVIDDFFRANSYGQVLFSFIAVSFVFAKKKKFLLCDRFSELT
jgi:hypothetical protein